jgi:hypothetical protein
LTKFIAVQELGRCSVLAKTFHDALPESRLATAWQPCQEQRRRSSRSVVWHLPHNVSFPSGRAGRAIVTAAQAGC